jgi:hypothetical protein
VCLRTALDEAGSRVATIAQVHDLQEEEYQPEWFPTRSRHDHPKLTSTTAGRAQRAARLCSHRFNQPEALRPRPLRPSIGNWAARLRWAPYCGQPQPASRAAQPCSSVVLASLMLASMPSTLDGDPSGELHPLMVINNSGQQPIGRRADNFAVGYSPDSALRFLPTMTSERACRSATT